MIKHIVGGIRVDDESLAVDDIAAVGAFGDFLSLDATMRHMRELSQPEVLDRRVREDWEARGAHGPVRPLPRQGARTSSPSTIRSRCPTTSRSASAPSWKRPTAPRASRRRREPRGSQMKDQLKQAIIDGNADAATGHDAGAARHRGLGPRDPRRGPAARHGGGRARACASGECFIPEVLLSARVMQACLDLLRPHMAAGDEAGMRHRRHRHRRGRPARHRQEPGRHAARRAPASRSSTSAPASPPPTSSPPSRSTHPNILGMSALLTTTLPHMSETIAALKDAGLRDARQGDGRRRPGHRRLRRGDRRRRLRRQRRHGGGAGEGAGGLMATDVHARSLGPRDRPGAQEAQEGAAPLRPRLLHHRRVHQPRHDRADGGLRRRRDVRLARLPHHRLPHPLRHDRRRDGLDLPGRGRALRLGRAWPSGASPARYTAVIYWVLEPGVDRRHAGGDHRGGHQQPDPRRADEHRLVHRRRPRRRLGDGHAVA